MFFVCHPRPDVTVGVNVGGDPGSIEIIFHHFSFLGKKSRAKEKSLAVKNHG